MADPKVKGFALEDVKGESPHENVLLRTLLTRAVTGEDFSVSVLELQPGGGHHWQSTDAFAEALFILEGEGKVEVEGQDDVHYRPGTAFVIPRGVRHQHLNWGTGIIRAVIIHYPARR